MDRDGLSMNSTLHWVTLPREPMMALKIRRSLCLEGILTSAAQDAGNFGELYGNLGDIHFEREFRGVQKMVSSGCSWSLSRCAGRDRKCYRGSSRKISEYLAKATPEDHRADPLQ